GFGLGWVNTGADYSRYLPRRTSGGGVVWWTTFGASVAPIFLLGFGLLLAGSSTSLSSAINTDPIGALATILPTWYLVPFVIVAVLGLVGGAVLDIYSSGLTLLGGALGFGLVVNSNAGWLSWQGYLLGPFGLGGKTGTWEFANLGVIVALAVGFLGWLALGRAAVRRQENAPATAGTT